MKCRTAEAKWSLMGKIFLIFLCCFIGGSRGEDGTSSAKNGDGLSTIRNGDGISTVTNGDGFSTVKNGTGQSTVVNGNGQSFVTNGDGTLFVVNGEGGMSGTTLQLGLAVQQAMEDDSGQEETSRLGSLHDYFLMLLSAGEVKEARRHQRLVGS